MTNTKWWKPFVLVTTITLSLLTGFVFGYGRGYKAGESLVDKSPVIKVPQDYLSNLSPVPCPQNGYFAFDTFTFTDVEGRQMAVPVPSLQ
ncbi:hypothetical protein V7x_54180 [Crateriforma conspicua]|uniref:Uncharacterized protein n=1 Tax=Crateriforma conspicua TaxID=2527996 RepID=A0A5C6FHR1_9PLAN|nr:hypothetical protein [Crateriforma conspicua]TWU61106.1 hypothetical protein V7x_54180 [Crateriforma conspicua]